MPFTDQHSAPGITYIKNTAFMHDPESQKNVPMMFCVGAGDGGEVPVIGQVEGTVPDGGSEPNNPIVIAIRNDEGVVQVPVAGSNMALPVWMPNTTLHIGRAGKSMRMVTGGATRPNNANIYSVGDVVAAAGGGMMSWGVNLTGSTTARIIGATLADYANQGTKGQFDLFLFSSQIPTINDGDPFVVPDTHMEFLLGVIRFDTPVVTNAAADGSCFYYGYIPYMPSGTFGQGLPVVVGEGDGPLYGKMVALNAYEPVVNEIFSIHLFVEMD